MGILRRARRDDVDVASCLANLDRLEAHGSDAPRDEPVEASYCQHVVAQDDVVAVTDSLTDELVRDNPSTGDVRAYLGVPIRRDGHCLGSFCVVDVEPRKWTDEDLAALEDLAQQVMATRPTSSNVILPMPARERRTLLLVGRRAGTPAPRQRARPSSSSVRVEVSRWRGGNPSLTAPTCPGPVVASEWSAPRMTASGVRPAPAASQLREAQGPDGSRWSPEPVDQVARRGA